MKHRIKTATGTIAIYEDLTPEQLAEKQAEADREAGGTAPDAPGPEPAPTVEEGGVQATLPSASASASVEVSTGVDARLFFFIYIYIFYFA